MAEPIATAATTETAPAEAATEATPAASGKAAASEAKADKPANGAAQFTPEELEAFRSQAAKLGYEIDAGKVTIRERAAFREERRRAKAAIEQMSAEERQKLDGERATTAKERAEHAERIKKVEAIEHAIEIGDYQELARLAGKRDWDDLQKDVIAKLADPNYKELQELKRKEAEREAKERQQAERAEREAQERAAAAEEAAIAQKQNEYRQYLARSLPQSKHPLISALAEDPTFIEAIYRIQQENWDPVTKTTVTPEQAIKLGIKGASMSLEDELRQLLNRLSRGLNTEPTSPSPSAIPAKGKSKTDTVPATKTEAAPAGKYKTDQEWVRHAARRLEEAAARDREEERARKP